MAAIRQMEADRRNAQKSSGPRTVEGKGPFFHERRRSPSSNTQDFNPPRPKKSSAHTGGVIVLYDPDDPDGSGHSSC